MAPTLPADEPTALRESLLHFACGSFSGALACLATFPIDLVKTRRMVDRRREPLSLRATIAHVWTYEGGARAFYRGLAPTLMGITLTWGCYFMTYKRSQTALLEHGWLADSPWTYMASAVAAGVTTDVLVAPVWVIKTRMQTQYDLGRRRVYTSMARSMMLIVREEGVRGLYKGLVPSLVGVTHVAIQFPLYEQFKAWLREPKPKRLIADERSASASGNTRAPTSAVAAQAGEGDARAVGATDDESKLALHQVVAASALSKMIASTAAYPHEVLRTRMQDNAGTPLRMLSTVRTIFAQEGWRALYRGLAVNLLRVVPSCVISFTTFEALMQLEWRVRTMS